MNNQKKKNNILNAKKMRTPNLSDSYSKADKNLLEQRLETLRQRRAALLEQVHEINEEIKSISQMMQCTIFEDNDDKNGGDVIEEATTRLTHANSLELADLVETQVASEVDFYLDNLRRLSLSSRRMTASAPEYVPSYHATSPEWNTTEVKKQTK